ncbi:thioredoxin fold domain-containing protein [Dyadobacter sp. LHD-138]|uniref:thioredoxin family protein n=1 Tax=Dyadobacter sp. LHD-138 TaxID=3071413 RepID=UPI0027E147A2|nr:thioredoxin fold domain-containing protein [Dyadobacter sp. LHD-138]MDQ6479476.1 DUF255 domain-containing protein [Dyadobacter sp. LHD-138]
MKRIFYIIVLIFAVLVSHAQPKAGIDFTASSWDETVRNAGKSGKQIFLYAQTKSCHFCRQMEKEAFTDPRVIDFYNANFISFKIDSEDKGAGEALSKQYGIMGFPTYLYFDKEGEKSHQSAGFKPSNDFIQDGKNASDPNTALFTLLSKYDLGERSPQLLFNLSSVLTYYMVKDNPKEKIVQEYLSTRSAQELESEKNLRFIFTNLLDFKTPTSQFFLKSQERFIPLFGKADVDKMAQRIITQTAFKAGGENNLALLGELKKIVATSFADTSKLLSLTQIYYFGGKRDWPGYAKSTLQYGKTVGANDWQTMYETGIYLKHFAKDKETLKIGIQVMDRVLKLHKNYEHLCIYSNLQNKVGNKYLALKAAKEAVKISKAEGEDSSEAEELITELTAIKK